MASRSWAIPEEAKRIRANFSTFSALKQPLGQAGSKNVHKAEKPVFHGLLCGFGIPWRIKWREKGSLLINS
ncbi:hypothetical protein [Neglectibacter sp. X4]|uniref:hypothetical protein n=1 Tax=Neglectibacter sp. X4 TaxID=2305472 RepID=UPI00136D8C78|nr:hypothetical protein [Neglectibacter sp. X4]